MVRYLEIRLKDPREDFRGKALVEKIRKYLGFDPGAVLTGRIYAFETTVDDTVWTAVSSEFIDPVMETRIDSHEKDDFDFVMKVGFNPGVTDNEGRTALEMFRDITGQKESCEAVYTSRIYMFRGQGLTKELMEKAAYGLVANKLIEEAEIYTGEAWKKTKEYTVPRITAEDCIKVNTLSLKGLTDSALEALSLEKMLALSPHEMKAIADYYDDPHVKAKRESAGFPALTTDAELEILAQTWSEHCKHKIFASTITYTDENGQSEEIRSLYKTYIKDATRRIMEKTDHIVSVFHDNSGVMRFNENNHVCYKVETHNSPSALDPYGGAMTGIVGVNRDIMGTGRGAVPHANVWGYCFADPDYEGEIPEGLMHPRRIREGVHKGVIDGGNQSGIPYARGWEVFDRRYLGKPLVYCGTVGVMPAMLHGRDSSEKTAYPGDLVVMAGGRIGKDGIHGATFSSRELDESSPVQAVQIGDPITQKKMTDFIIEARDLGLYNAITDNGAGGLASSVGEMAEGPGGVEIDLAKAPLKYHGLQPWEILISEAQERMTLAVPPEKIKDFMELAEIREVECAVLGTFNDSGLFKAYHGAAPVCLLEMSFLHDGLPEMRLEAVWESGEKETATAESQDISGDLKALLEQPDISSKEEIMRTYDHEVKGLTVMKPLTGVKGDVAGDATIVGVEYGSHEGVVLTEGINPHYSEGDTYHMTASIIDEAVRKAVAAGARLDHMAVLDNFCWPDPVYDPGSNPDGKYKLAQLVRSCKALEKITTEYGAPCISGKDSMKNDARLNGKKISILPTLLISLMGKIDDFTRAVYMEPPGPGYDIWLAGKTYDETLGSQYALMKDLKGGTVPRVRSKQNIALYRAYEKCVKKGLVQSAHSPAKGGIAASLMLQALAGRTGMKICLDKISTDSTLTDTALLFSESNGRIIFTARKEDRKEIEAMFTDIPVSVIGETKSGSLDILRGGKTAASLALDELEKRYKGRFNEI